MSSRGGRAGRRAARVQTATLTGLYESGGTPPSQLCIIEQGRAARFGLVIRRQRPARLLRRRHRDARRRDPAPRS